MSPGHQILKVHQIKGTVLIRVSFVGYSEKKSPKVSEDCYIRNTAFPVSLRFSPAVGGGRRWP